jgi:hypothetical protein
MMSDKLDFYDNLLAANKYLVSILSFSLDAVVNFVDMMIIHDGYRTLSVGIRVEISYILIGLDLMFFLFLESQRYASCTTAAQT